MTVGEEVAAGMKALDRKAIEAYSAGRLPEALEMFGAIAALEREANLAARAAESLVNCANVAYAMHRHDVAREKLAAALPTFRRVGDARGQFAVLQLRAQMKVEEGDLTGAAALFEDCLRLRCGAKEHGTANFQLAVLALRRHEIARARLLLDRAIAALESSGDAQRLAEALRQRDALDLRASRRPPSP